LWGGVPVNADTILRTNFTSLSTASNFLMGDLNSSVSKQFPNGQSEHSEEYHASARDAIIKKLFDALLYSSRKEERCAGTVWLVSLTKYCGNHPIIQKMLPEIQVLNLETKYVTVFSSFHFSNLPDFLYCIILYFSFNLKICLMVQLYSCPIIFFLPIFIC
jgi:hypothetical protein